MYDRKPLYINVKGELYDLSHPRVMGILNATPDSFYALSRKRTEKDIEERVCQMRDEGVDIIDVGGYSSRPGAAFVSEDEEMSRLDMALTILFREYPEAVVSIDTFRSGIAHRCIENYGVAMINDISAGEMDPEMFEVVARLGVPYIIMHMKGTPQTMMENINYDNLQQEIFLYFARKIEDLRLRGVADIIVDPGFGFSKTTGQNYALMNCLKEFNIFELPILVGISRKTMIREILNCSPEDSGSLTGTIVLNTLALDRGANILRVHDVKEAVDAIRIYNKTIENKL